MEEEGSLLWVEQAVRSDLLEVAGQHMLEEAVDKLLCRYGDDFSGTGFAMAIAEGDAAIVEGEDIAIADGDERRREPGT